MIIKNKVKGLVKMIFGKRPIQLTANIVKLAPSQLLNGRAALITGGTRGIGFSIAEAMLDAGAAKVVITGRGEDRCREAIKKMIASDNSREGRVFFQVMNNCNVSSFDNALKEVREKLGETPLSILVNNAGVQSPQFGDTTEEQYDNCVDTNIKGAYFLSQKVARYMVDHNVKGNILNVASASSIRPAANAYTLSKVGIKEMTAGIAKTLISNGIVVNGVAPGPTATPMLMKSENASLTHPYNPLGRFAMPEEIANMAVMLTSDMGRTIVGSIVYMTGGAGIFTYDDVQYPF